MTEKFHKRMDKIDNMCDDTLKYAEAIGYLLCCAYMKIDETGEQYTRRAVEECVITPAYESFNNFIAKYARGDFS